MTDITKSISSNIGSFKSFEYCFIEDVQTFTPDVPNLEVSIALKSGKVWSDIEHTSELSQVNLNDISDKAEGPLYNNKLQIMIPKVRKDISVLIDLMARKGFILRCTDFDNNKHIIGSVNNPIFAINSEKRSFPGKGYSGYELAINHNQTHHTLYQL